MQDPLVEIAIKSPESAKSRAETYAVAHTPSTWSSATNASCTEKKFEKGPSEKGSTHYMCNERPSVTQVLIWEGQHKNYGDNCTGTPSQIFYNIVRAQPSNRAMLYRRATWQISESLHVLTRHSPGRAPSSRLFWILTSAPASVLG